MRKLYKATSIINGTGLFCDQDLRAGQHISFIDGPIVTYRTLTPAISENMLNWIGVSKHSWINTNQSIFRFINHSCDPNVAHISRRKVIARQDIPAGTELTMDYSLTEAEKDWSIGPCGCRSKNCRGTITDVTKLPRKVFLKNQHIIPKKFQELYKRTHDLPV